MIILAQVDAQDFEKNVGYDSAGQSHAAHDANGDKPKQGRVCFSYHCCPFKKITYEFHKPNPPFNKNPFTFNYLSITCPTFFR
jgi:hypothetical protein